MREFRESKYVGKLTLREYLYLCYFYNHLRSLGVYESFIEQATHWNHWNHTEIHAFIKKQMIAQRYTPNEIQLVNRCLYWGATTEGVDFWRDINAKIAPYTP